MYNILEENCYMTFYYDGFFTKLERKVQLNIFPENGRLYLIKLLIYGCFWIFKEKVKKVIPQLLQFEEKNFVKGFIHKYDLIKDLKNFRDEIVHTKSFEGIGTNNFYERLYVTSLNFEYDKVLFAARDYINFHQENLIEECLCGND